MVMSTAAPHGAPSGNRASTAGGSIGGAVDRNCAASVQRNGSTRSSSSAEAGNPTLISGLSDAGRGLDGDAATAGEDHEPSKINTFGRPAPGIDAVRDHHLEPATSDA